MKKSLRAGIVVSALVTGALFLFAVPGWPGTLAADQCALTVEWNNPFDPASGQVTRFRYTALDKDRSVRIRVYTVAGVLVRAWDEHTILKGVAYTQEWDGRNADGAIVARGLYFVNMLDTVDGDGMTKRVYVVKR